MKFNSLIVSFLLSLVSVVVFGQAKKPTIMVIPSDNWCIANGFYSEVNMDGVSMKAMDYQRAFQENSEIRVIISKMGDIMAARDFPIKSTEQTLKDMVTDEAYISLIQSKESGSPVQETEIDILNRKAKPDIILDLDYKINRIGPKKQISFNLTAIDAYSKNIISGNTGVGSECTAPLTTLLEEAVLSYMDNFTMGLQNFFDDMFENGRNITVELKLFESAGFDFETEYEYNGQTAELADIIYVWFEDNTVQGRFDERSRSATSVIYNDVRMPLMGKSLSGKERAMSASNYMNGLVNFLKQYDIPAKKIIRGQGQVILVLGEK